VFCRLQSRKLKAGRQAGRQAGRKKKRERERDWLVKKTQSLFSARKIDTG
jgi:hypothetical protein